MKYYGVVFIILAGILFIAYENAKFSVSDDEQVVITQFGKIADAVHSEPGDYYKIPFLQKTHYFKKNVYELKEVRKISTLDNKEILVNLQAGWKISDPIAFYKGFNNIDRAKDYIRMVLADAGRTIVAEYNSDDQIFRPNDPSDETAKPYSHLNLKIKSAAEKKLPTLVSISQL